MSTRAAVVIAVILLAAIAGAAVLASCATKPVRLCERPQFERVVDEDGRHLYALDEAGMRKLLAMAQGLESGTCRVPAKGEV